MKDYEIRSSKIKNRFPRQYCHCTRNGKKNLHRVTSLPFSNHCLTNFLLMKTIQNVNGHRLGVLPNFQDIELNKYLFISKGDCLLNMILFIIFLQTLARR